MKMYLKQMGGSLRSTTAAISMSVLLVNGVAALPSQALDFPPSANRGAPERTAGGGVRGDTCTAADQEGQILLTALAPSNNVGTTTVATPTLFVYVPQVANKSAEFLLIDEAGKDAYTTTIQLPKIAGVVQIKLPKAKDNGDLLVPSKTYSWRFSVICDASDRTRDLTVEGVVERVAKKQELEKAVEEAKIDPLKVAELYAKAGIWQETLVYAAKARQAQPAAWAQLLKSVGLEKLANAPFVN